LQRSPGPDDRRRHAGPVPHPGERHLERGPAEPVGGARARFQQTDAGAGARGSLGGDLVTLTARLNELDKVLKSASGLISKVLGAGESDDEEVDEHPREFGGAGS